MDRPRFIRGLRIALSTACGMVCILLIVLWIRSYYRFDWWGPGITLVGLGPVFNPNSGFIFESAQGTLAVWYVGNLRESTWWAWSAGSSSPESQLRVTGDQGESALDGFRATTHANGSFRGSVPLWFPALFSGVFAALVWIRPSFSLRTLLIATTLIAILLATAAYLRLW